MARTALHLACTAAIVLNLGCSNRGPVPEPIRLPSALAPLEPRVDAVVGRSVVVPIYVASAADVPASLEARLDDGRTVDAEVRWMGPVSSTPAPWWLADPGTWASRRLPAESSTIGGGLVCLVALLPVDGQGQGLWVGSRRIALSWLPDPYLEMRRIEAKRGGNLWGHEGLDSTVVHRLAQMESRSPMTRWRARLVDGRLAPRGPVEVDATGLPVDDPVVESDTFADPVVEALARQLEARWQLALLWLHEADPALCDRFRRRLVATAEFPGGVRVPVWPIDPADLDALVADLADVRRPPAKRIDRAALWLEAQPSGTAWVIDDAGQRDGLSDAPVATIGMANLGEHRVMASLAWEDRLSAPELAPLARGECTAMNVAHTSAGPDRSLLAEVPPWQGRLRILGGAEPLKPPGFPLNAFSLDWSLPAWLSGVAVPDRVDPSFATMGILQRAPDGRGWALLIECALASGADPDREVVRAWFGPRGHPTAVIRVAGGGDAAREGQESAVIDARITREADRWTCMVPIPPDAIGRDGIVRVGVERFNAHGLRSAWPRAMLPWQTEPGRAALDTRTWGELGSRD